MNVALLDILQQANAIDILVKILAAEGQGPHPTVCDLVLDFVLYHSILVSGIFQSHLSNLL